MLAWRANVVLVSDNKQLCQVSGRAPQERISTLVRIFDQWAGHFAMQRRFIRPGSQVLLLPGLSLPRLPPQGCHPTLPLLCSCAAPS